MGRHINHTKPRNRIITHRNSQRHNDNNECQRFLTHTEHCSKKAEQYDNQRDYHIIDSQHLNKPIPLEPFRES